MINGKGKARSQTPVYSGPCKGRFFRYQVRTTLSGAIARKLEQRAELDRITINNENLIL